MTENTKTIIASIIACVIIFGSSKIHAAEKGDSYHQLVDKNGEVVVFTPQPNDKQEGDIVVALITAGGYQKVDTLPENAVDDVQCIIESAKQSTALLVECYELGFVGSSIHKIYDPALGNIGYENLPELIEDLREDLRKEIQSTLR